MSRLAEIGVTGADVGACFSPKRLKCGRLRLVTPVEEIPASWVRKVLAALNKQNLAFMVFEAALPSLSRWDAGVGTAHGRGGTELLDFLSGLGFNGLQLGPRGAISVNNPSPYDATTFSINPLFLDMEALCRSSEGQPALVDESFALQVIEQCVGARDATRTSYETAFAAHRLLAANVCRRADLLTTTGEPHAEPFVKQLASFRRQQAFWLLADALYEPLCELHRSSDHGSWEASSPASPEAACDRALWDDAGSSQLRGAGVDALFGFCLPRAAASRLGKLLQQFQQYIDSYSLLQYLLYTQESQLRASAERRGIELYGDLAIGYSRRDQWHFAGAFLQGYLLGAPPSRTNPSGQPWGYPVLDPRQYRPGYRSRGLAASLLSARSANYFSRFDKVRIDHPHGIVCPWVYRAGTGDDLNAVQRGARLFSTPDGRGHADLAAFSLVAASQLDRNVPAHADGAIVELSHEQILAFSRAFELVAAEAGGEPSRLICEVLSTQPRELGCVMSRYGLGRFRVTQKANPEDRNDVYRTENARPEDWVLLGNHDTPSIWSCIERWKREGSVGKQAAYLAARLATSDDHRRELEQRFQSSDFELAHAKLAELFVCDARNVLVAFTDLFGLQRPYNLPGVVSSDNWSLRLPASYREDYHASVKARRALSLPKALLLAAAKRVPGSELLDLHPALR